MNLLNSFASSRFWT